MSCCHHCRISFFVCLFAFATLHFSWVFCYIFSTLRINSCVPLGILMTAPMFLARSDELFVHVKT